MSTAKRQNITPQISLGMIVSARAKEIVRSACHLTVVEEVGSSQVRLTSILFWNLHNGFIKCFHQLGSPIFYTKCSLLEQLKKKTNFSLVQTRLFVPVCWVENHKKKKIFFEKIRRFGIWYSWKHLMYSLTFLHITMWFSFTFIFCICCSFSEIPSVLGSNLWWN